jgi:hypothetical protein
MGNEFRVGLAAAFCLGTLGAAVAPVPARAESFTSSASSASSASVGSLSTSVERSSASSGGGDKKASAGEYRIVGIGAAPAREGYLRLTLQQGAGAAPSVYLTLPEAVAGEAGLVTGLKVAVRERDYGLEFARAVDGRSFFLALTDAWYDDLQTRRVGG